MNEINTLSAMLGVGDEKPLRYGGECYPHPMTKEVLGMEIVALCCDIDDGRLQFVPLWQRHLVSDGQRQMWRKQRLCLSEVMTIVVSFHL